MIKLLPKDGAGRLVVLPHGTRVFSLTELSDGRLASGGNDGIIKLWPNDGMGEPVILQHGSQVRVLSLAELGDGRLASGGDDSKIKLWPKDRAGEPIVMEHGSPVSSLAGLPDGRLASGGGDGKIKVWLVDETKLIAAACLRAGRNLSKDEWTRYVGSAAWRPSCRDRPSNWRTPER
jgi:WD40 repeat protein